MTVSTEIETQIMRYYHVEKWRVGTIARELAIHHSVVQRILNQAGVVKAAATKRPSILDPYMPFILNILEKYPDLCSSRIFNMLRERGYTGGPDHLRHTIALYRPRKTQEAYLRLRTLPGEQAQADWGHFGNIMIGKAKRPLMAFVMVLSYSRQIFLQFYLNQQFANFIRGHIAAFNLFQGIPRVILYDNLKSAVSERVGNAIRFHPELLAFASHCRFEPRPVAIARGNEKGRVERAIRYVRDNFFAARQWQDLNDLNQQAMHWCSELASLRPCPEDKSITVKHAFLQEQSLLTALPSNPYPSCEQMVVKSGKTPYVRFDLNDYSIPHNKVQRILTISATLTTVNIYDKNELLASHPRSFDKAQQIEVPEHIDALVKEKRQAQRNHSLNRLTHATPLIITFFTKAAEKGYNLGRLTQHLTKLLNQYGRDEFAFAIKQALQQNVTHANGVRQCLQQRFDELQMQPPIAVDLPDDPRVNNIIVNSPELASYDQLKTNAEQE